MILLALALSAGGCVEVEGDRILAGDLAKAVPEFAGVAAHEPVSFSPLPGARRVLPRQDLSRLASRFSIPDRAWDAVCFEMKAQPLQTDALREALQSALPGATVEVVDHTREPAPAGRPFFIPQSGSRQADGSMLYRGRIEYGGRRTFPIWVKAKVRMARTRVIAVEDLAAGQPVQEPQITVEGTGPGMTAGDVIGKIVRRRIRRGDEVEPSMLTAPKEVAPGDLVEVEVMSGAAKLKFPAKAVAGGRRGDTIVMTNPSSGARFSGKITGPGQVTVAVDGKDTK